MKRTVHFNCGLIVTLMMLALSAHGFGQQVDRDAWRVGAVTPTEFTRRIEEAAVQYSDYAPIPRVIFYDIAYPSDPEEYSDLDGHAVLLLSAFSQQAGELPLKRIYFVHEGKEIELKLIKSWPQQTVADGAIAKTFGRHRMDALYLMPIYLRVKNAPLLADFATNRNGFRVANFTSGVPPQVSRLPIGAPTGADFSATALIRFIRREYPGLLKE